MTRSLFSGGARAPRRAAAAVTRPPTRRLTRQPRHLAEPLEARTLLNAFVVTNGFDSDGGSLRQAILNANANPGPDEIQFNLNGLRPILLSSPLPALTGPTTIDGTTQPGYVDRPLIELDGANAGPGADGLVLLARPSVVRGLAITRFSRHGVVFRQLSNDTRSQPLNLLEASHIGISAAGDAARPNGGAGVLVAAPFTRVRQGNVISGNAGPGVWALPESGTWLVGVTVENNYIGTDAAGGRAVGNGREGILVEGVEGHINQVQVDLFRNVISGNGASGVRVSNIRQHFRSIDVTLTTNFVGTNAAGTQALPNGTSAGATYRDGVTFTEGAIISLSGERDPANGGKLISRNVISGNPGAGVRVTSGAILIGGAYVGTDITGSRPLGNGGGGIAAEGAARFTIAGAVVSGNSGDGIRVVGVLSTLSEPSKVYNSIVGISADGRNAVGNTGNGVYVRGSGNVQVGSLPVPGFDLPTELPPNYIGGNGGHGVTVEGEGTLRDAPTVYVRRNRIGIGLDSPDANGRPTAPAIGNAGSGVYLSGVNRVNVDGNMIGWNRGDGITVGNVGAASSSNLIENNDIGARPQTLEGVDMGNAGNGVSIVEGSNNTLDDNDIAYNDGSGVLVRAGQGNFIDGFYVIRNNGRLPIDLAPDGVEGRTPNDPLDADEGPNGVQNHPVIHWAVKRARGETYASYSLHSKPGRRYALHFFADRLWVGGVAATTDVNGDASGIVQLNTQLSDHGPITATATDMSTRDTSEYSDPVVPARSAIVAAYFVYNNSVYDGHDPEGTMADTNAIAPGKVPSYDPRRATENNRTNYDKGINGIMLDLAGLPPGQGGVPVTPENFRFVVRDTVWQGGVRVGRIRPAPAPTSFSVWRGAGVAGSDRLVITWPDGAIRNAWLKVTLVPGGAQERPLYFGNLVGDASGVEYAASGGASLFRVNALDVAMTRKYAAGVSAGKEATLDFNRDGRLDAIDLAIVRSNFFEVLDGSMDDAS